MKTRTLIGVVCLGIALGTRAQNDLPPKNGAYSVTSRDAHTAIWQRTDYEQLPSGRQVPHIHRFTETATGLNFFDSNSRSWQPSVEDIEPVQGGAAATQGQHKVTFSADLATTGAINLQMPDGQNLTTELIGLAYTDQGTGKTVFIAVVTNSIGAIIGRNQVWYENAFAGLKASVHYTYSKAGFEQDVVFEECPSPPEGYGLNSATTVLQAVTAIESAPAVAISTSQASLDGGLSDDTINFPAMMIGRGRAFLIGDNDSAGVPVSKQWTVLSGQRVLVEQIPMPHISAQLQTLSPLQSSATKFSNSVANVVSAKRVKPVARRNSQPMKFASLRPRKRGFVLDYTTINTSQTNYTFEGDMTYYLSGNVSLFGTNTVFEGGSSIKYASGVSLTVNTPVTWNAKPFHPVVMLPKDEDDIGQQITGSTGNPGGAYYAATALFFDGSTANSSLNIENLRVANAQIAVAINSYNHHLLSDLQILNCGNGIAATNTDVTLRNGLFYNVQTNFSGNTATNTVEQLTSDIAMWLNKDIGTNLFLTNCLLTAVTNIGSWFPDHVVVTNRSGVFQTVGAGSHYLAVDSPYVNGGTTNINPATLTALQQKTTYPPIVYSNATFTVATVFGPQVQRDADIPDLGYHYDPLDWAFGGVTADANLTFDAGTAVGYFETASGSYGIQLSNNIVNSFNGTVTAPCVFARYSSVQEGNGNWAQKGTLAGITTVGDSSYYGEIDAKFTHFYEIYGDPNHIRDYLAKLDVHANNCEFNSGNMAGYWLGLFTTNCFFDRLTEVGSRERSDGIYWRNCTMHGGDLIALHSIDPVWQVWIENCAFDVSTNEMDDNSSGDTNITYCDYNGLLNGAYPLAVLGAHDRVTNSFTWQKGLLGTFYQPTNSLLINTGSITASGIGLYHFTTTTNQVKETNSVVDIGYHYVAVDSSGNPPDSNGNGTPDYIEDVNGNGLVDSGEIGWNISGDLGLKVLITRPKNNSLIP